MCVELLVALKATSNLRRRLYAMCVELVAVCLHFIEFWDVLARLFMSVHLLVNRILIVCQSMVWRIYQTHQFKRASKLMSETEI